VGGAEYVSYQHVLMAHRNGLDVFVLSGTTGKFYELMKNAGVCIAVVGMNPTKELLGSYIKGYDVVFNCNFFGVLPLVSELKKSMDFAHLLILHNNTDYVYNQSVRYDATIDLYYSIHQIIVDSFTTGRGILNPAKFVVIPNCVDAALIGSIPPATRNIVRNKYGYKDHDFVIGMVTRVAGDKNILDACKIISQLPPEINARLLIVGGAAANAASIRYFQKLTATINGSMRLRTRVTITGNLVPEMVYKTMMAFDLGLNCSPSEGLPIALLEMMAAGIACVMPAVGDIHDVLFGRGIVVPLRQRMTANEIFAEPCYTPEEIKRFTTAVSLLHKDAVMREQYGLVSKQFIQTYRSLTYQEKEFLKFIDMGKTKKEAGSRKPEVGKEEMENKTNDRQLKQTAKDISPKMETEAIAKEPDVKLPRVSVLMPTRDGDEAWIREAIDSISKQDYKGELEFVIVAHDCRLSMGMYIDKLVSEFDQDSNTDNRLHTYKKVFISDGKVTFSEALDIGVNECTCEIIVRMDHDDIAEPQLVSRLVNYLTKHPEISVCGVQVKFFGSKSIVTNHPQIVNRKLAFVLPNHWFVNHPGVAMRKESLLKVGGYGKVVQGYAEDYQLWCKFLKAGYVIANLPEVLMNYRTYKHERVRPEGYMAFLAKEKAQLA